MKKTLLTALIALAAASPMLAQDAGKGGQKGSTTPATAPAHAMRATEITLPVTGLSTENEAKVQAALTATMTPAFACPKCEYVQAKAGECKECMVALEKKDMAAFSKVATAVDASDMQMTVSPHLDVRLSTIQKSLRPSAVEIQREKLALGQSTVLVYKGGASKEEAKELQDAFTAAKIAGATAAYDPDSKEIRVHLGAGKLAWATVADLGSKLQKPLSLNDVIWVSAPRA